MVTKVAEMATIFVVADDTVVHETSVLNVAAAVVAEGE
jgi:hypothetical protein